MVRGMSILLLLMMVRRSRDVVSKTSRSSSSSPLTTFLFDGHCMGKTAMAIGGDGHRR